MTADRRDLISALGGRFVPAPAAMDDDYLVADDSVEGRPAMTAAVFSPIEWTDFEGFKNGVPLNVWELEDLLYGFLTPWDVSVSSSIDPLCFLCLVEIGNCLQELNMLFSKWDDAGFGEIEADRFRAAVYDPEFRATMAHLSDPQALARLENRANDRRPITYQEFVDLVSARR